MQMKSATFEIPKAQMARVWTLCKTKMVCELDDPKDDGSEPDGEEVKRVMDILNCR